jgi:hypothetical protein
MKTKKITGLLLSIILLISALLISCGSGGGSNSGSSQSAKSSSDPEGLVEDYMEYFKDGDYRSMLLLIEGNDKMSEADLEKQVTFMEQGMKMAEQQRGAFKGYEILEVAKSDDGKSATVKVKSVYEKGKEEIGDTKVVKVNGKWKIKKENMF